jgi:hypothetical protein
LWRLGLKEKKKVVSYWFQFSLSFDHNNIGIYKTIDLARSFPFSWDRSALFFILKLKRNDIS